MTDTTPEQYEAVLDAAVAAAPVLAATTPTTRAALLRAVAGALEEHADALVPLAVADSHLPVPRLRGEVTRTAVQFEMFADALEEGSWLEAIIDLADAQARPAPRPDLRRMLVPLGPVAVFGASNFPFAFGVAGGDTASALAAGCPVVVKGHPGQPSLTDPYAAVVAEALRAAGAPEGVVGVVHGDDNARRLVQDPRIHAVGFTGSTAGGRALADLAAARPRPIPFYGELGSLNPVFVTPAAATARGEDIARAYVASATLGAGQFCTKPGLLFVPAGSGLDKTVVEAAGAVAAAPLLNERIRVGWRRELERLAAHPRVRLVAGSPADSGADSLEVSPVFLATDVADLEASGSQLLAECFGPFSLIVEYRDEAELLRAARLFDGNLTATVHGEGPDDQPAAALLDALRDSSGRLIWNGWPTGVAVSWAQHHGGPYPSTNSLHTSVGVTALRRFLRPVAYQDLPDPLLPEALRNTNPLGIPRRVNGRLTTEPIG
ncbi:aldehyde dehydrogenase (NADP(+)) [Allostreptomyces psammosilenae]|uniref:NADP-dependent aldehyde dehydrogenase n=1 Tax=Allostreptomyces psammosilenae TaxID=1892865 RepID=A0A852ZX10_9ACTN|nr:aldehyde dehydrogenase (NADP(+)) [Allostreptomyces psammosilenae]NYI03181.1 NADP-dependent aldehyde dehydrogenase [Allostreptomyces psammosilenae]